MPAGIKITPLRRADIPELRQFLITGFGASETTECFSHDVLTWKYFDGPGGPTENSVCSLTARSDGKIVGHIGICPRQFVVTGGNATPVSTMHAIDWMGSPDHSGSGAFLMLQAIATCKIQYAVGGSANAQAVFPRLGFEPKRTVVAFRKVLSPFYRLRTAGQGLFRRWAGAAKDAASVWRSRTPRVSQPVELRPAPQFTEEVDGLVRQSSARMVTCQRDHALLNYFLRYPQPGFTGWTIHLGQRMIGSAILKVTPQGRIKTGKIVDCWLDSEDPACWQAAVAALVDRLQTLSADVVTCYGTTPDLHDALLWNGFAKSGESNVFVRDKQQSLPSELPFGLSMLEADHALL
jgi:hypothetical protein